MMMMIKGGGSARGNGNPGEKPLEELSHQDIMQLTREDCRRYLKEKGMRRPSWNKSQAIQQVLSLKNLFHSTPEEPPLQGEGEPPQPPLPLPLPIPLPLPLPILAELPVLATQNALSTNTTTTRSGAQLTIFYSGDVNVYNDVPAEKAQAIMLLAAAANHLPLPNTQDAPSPSLATTTQLLKETPVTRKASLQRFLEKKKDRGRCKGGAAASKKQPPMLMGMFMHPSYWSEAGKSKACTKPTHAPAPAPSPSPSPSPSPTTPPHTPSSDEQRNSIILNSTRQPS